MSQPPFSVFPSHLEMTGMGSTPPIDYNGIGIDNNTENEGDKDNENDDVQQFGVNLNNNRRRITRTCYLNLKC